MKRFKSYFSPLSLGEGAGVRPLSLLLLASLFLASCGEQTELEQPTVDNGGTVAVTQEIRVEVLPMQTVGGGATRSASGAKPEKGEAIGITYTDDAATRVQTDSDNMTAQESEIKNAYVVQFFGIGPRSTVAWVSGDIKSQLSSGSPITCRFDMSGYLKNRVYVVANVATVPTVGMTLADFEKPVTFAPTTSVPSTGLPMAAMQDVGVGDVLDVFRLRSVLAKLKFTTSAGILKMVGVPNAYTFAVAQPGDNAVRPNGIIYGTTGINFASGTTYYVPANLSGRVQLSSHQVRCSLFAPADAMLVQISANSTTYNIYLGDGSVSDFNVVGGCAYNINVTLYGTHVDDLRVGTPNVTALDVLGTANCYIATTGGQWHSFDATVMGNGAITPAHPKSTVLGDASFDAIVPYKLNPASAEVLWESVNTATAPIRGTIVGPAAHVAKGRLLFRTSAAAGNAVIAAKDAAGTILWSWHIWRIGDTPTGRALATITNGAGFTAPALTIMDRNLGALRATPNTGVAVEQDYGLFYQWGRKDPFQTQGTVTTAAGGSHITPADAVKKPTTFYTSSDDWTTRNDNLWGCPLTARTAAINTNQFNKNAGIKSIYDPCPVGWKVMPAYAFANATVDNSPWDDTNKGRNFAVITTSAGTPFFLPASGLREFSNGGLNVLSTYGSYWSSSPNDEFTMRGGYLTFNNTFRFLPLYYASRSYGFSVRCVKDL